MKTLTLAAIRCSLMFTAVAALSVAHPTSVQAVPTTYRYVGNPFTLATGPYTTSDFVTGMFTLTGPLTPNMPLTTITPIAFTFSDGVQTLMSSTHSNGLGVTFEFEFATGDGGVITEWIIVLQGPTGLIETLHYTLATFDIGAFLAGGFGDNAGPPGSWQRAGAVVDTGSTVTLMTLILMALGLATRRFKRAAT